MLLIQTFTITTIQANTPADTLLEADNFQELSQLMQEKKLPLLLMVRADYCDFCHRLEAEHLLPMSRDENYTRKILIRTFDLGGSREITGFDGKLTDANTFSRAYQLHITPTLLFLDAEGAEIAERIPGYSVPEYYGAYLDQAIDAAVEEMKRD